MGASWGVCLCVAAHVVSPAPQLDSVTASAFFLCLVCVRSLVHVCVLGSGTKPRYPHGPFPYSIGEYVFSVDELRLGYNHLFHT